MTLRRWRGIWWRRSWFSLNGTIGIQEAGKGALSYATQLLSTSQPIRAPRCLAFHLTEGQAGDSPQFEILLDLGPDITPRAAVGDKGYDAKANRMAARERNICPVIPFKASAQNRPAFFPKALYRARARIEQLIGKLKRFKRIALRCEKTTKNFGSFIAFALGLIIVKSVHTA